MLKPLFILPSLNAGGAERVVLNVLRHLDRRRFAPHLFLIRREGVFWDEIPEGVRVSYGAEPCLKRRYALPVILGRLLSLAMRSHVIVGALELEVTYYALLAGQLTRRPVVGWVHTSLPYYLANMSRAHARMSRAHARIVPLAYPRLAQVVGPSVGAALTLRSLVPLTEAKVRVIPNPLEVDWIRVRAAEPLPDWAEPIFERPVVLGVGRLSDEKGFDVLIRAHAALRARGVDHHLLLLGEGPEREGLRVLAAVEGVSDTVFMPGFVGNPYSFTQAAALFVLSSRVEGLPMVLLEALALGTAVIAADCPSGPREILDGGQFGALVPPEKVDALVATLEQLFKSPQLRSNVSRLGRSRAEEFRPECVIPQWENLLGEMSR